MGSGRGRYRPKKGYGKKAKGSGRKRPRPGRFGRLVRLARQLGKAQGTYIPVKKEMKGKIVQKRRRKR